MPQCWVLAIMTHKIETKKFLIDLQSILAWYVNDIVCFKINDLDCFSFRYTLTYSLQHSTISLLFCLHLQTSGGALVSAVCAYLSPATWQTFNGKKYLGLPAQRETCYYCLYNCSASGEEFASRTVFLQHHKKVMACLYGVSQNIDKQITI